MKISTKGQYAVRHPDKRVRTTLCWNNLDTKIKSSVPLKKEILFIPEDKNKALHVRFEQTSDGGYEIVMGGTKTRFAGKGLWADVPTREHIGESTRL